MDTANINWDQIKERTQSKQKRKQIVLYQAKVFSISQNVNELISRAMLILLELNIPMSAKS